METTAKQRLIEYLKKKGIGQNKFESLAGLSIGYISKLRIEPSPTKLRSILNAAPDLNREWLLTGEGEMLTTSPASIPGVVRASELSESPPMEPGPARPRMLPEVDFEFAAGPQLRINEREAVTRHWYLPDCTDCEAVVPVVGNSMLPNLPPGCFVALKRYNLTGDNPNTIPFGQIFGIVVEDEHTGEFHGHIKVLRRHKDPELAKSFWIAHSFNTAEFDDFDIAIQQVHSLWIVKQHIVSDTIY